MDLEVYDSGVAIPIPKEIQGQLGRFAAQQKYGLKEKDFTPSTEERQQRAAADFILEKYEFLRILSTCRYYYRDKNDTSLIYTPVSVKEDRDLRNMVKDAYAELGIAFTHNKVKNTVETLKEYVDMEQDSINKDLIEVNKGWYWDIEETRLVKHSDKACFIKLFDNSGHDVKDKYRIDPGEIVMPLVVKKFNDTLKWLETMGGVLPIPTSKAEIQDYIAEGMPELPYFDFIDTWACGNEGVYNDILKASAAVFMKNKPVGAFILTGLMRNGKSTYVKMLHMMLGRANTSSVRLAELHDPHKNLTLLGTLLNAPDEEIEGKDMSEEATADFKSMAAHEELTLPVMYSAQPQPVSTDFVMFCPMNDDPEWKGNSASACTQRSLIIPFYADLTKFDNNGRDFIEETFTATMFQNLLGVLFAFAHYYKDKKIEFSSTMEKERKTAAEVSDSRVNFANLFCKWFVGYSNENIVYDEYRSWCDYYDYKYTSKRKLMFAIDKVAHGRSRTRISIGGGPSQFVTRLGKKPGNQFFAEEYEIPGFKRTVGSILYADKYYSEGEKSRTGKSVIVALEEWQANQFMGGAKE